MEKPKRRETHRGANTKGQRATPRERERKHATQKAKRDNSTYQRMLVVPDYRSPDCYGLDLSISARTEIRTQDLHLTRMAL